MSRELHRHLALLQRCQRSPQLHGRGVRLCRRQHSDRSAFAKGMPQQSCRGGAFEINGSAKWVMAPTETLVRLPVGAAAEWICQLALWLPQGEGAR